MKRTLILLALAMGLASCHKGPHKPVHGSFISLIDDTYRKDIGLKPLHDPILSLFDLEHDPSQEATLRINVVGRPIETIHIDNTEQWHQGTVAEEAREHNRLINWFYASTRNSFQDYQSMYGGGRVPGRNEIFAAVASELNEAVHKGAAQSKVIVFSDLEENNADFDYTIEKGQELVRDNPQKVADILEHHCKLPDNLTGISVYLVYRAKDYTENTRFEHMAEIYKYLLQERGARVIIQSTNQTYQL